MDKKELVIVGIIVVIAIIVAAIMFMPHSDTKTTSLEILNKKAVGENGTVYIKLKDDANGAVSGKTVHVKITKDKNVVYSNDVETHSTGVAIVKLTNVSSGDYNINVTFDGDANYTESSISQKLTVGEGDIVDEQLENSTIIQQTLDDAQNTQDSADTSSYSQSSYSYTPSYTPSSSSQSSSSQSSSSSSSDLPAYDENGRETLPEFDEDGNQI